MRKHHIKGFTIIEMLVVVAIIGLLSSVILTALGPARDKAKDSRIIQEVNQVRSVAETLYNGSYDALETENFRNENLKALADDIAAQGGALAISKSSPALSKTYAAYSNLNTKAGDTENPIIQYYCIDSAGHSLVLNDPPVGPVCK